MFAIALRSTASASRRRYGTGAGKDLRVAPREHSCGIPPWDQKAEPTPVVVKPLPDFLIRPPCYPGQTRGEFQTCKKGEEGVYCTPCRLKYKYPPFSENIDFTPSDPECWWRSHESCLFTEDSEQLIGNLTRTQPCPFPFQLQPQDDAKSR